MNIIDGKKIANGIKEEVKKEIKNLPRKLGLGIILATQDAASKMFVKKKIEAAEELGIKAELVNISKDSKNLVDEIKNVIERFNQSDNIHGVLIQLPLPYPFGKNELEILSLIDSRKDVDCLHPYNQGKLLNGKPEIYPAVVGAIMEIFKDQKIELEGKKIAVVGWGETVGKPLVPVLISKRATVTICHEFTKDLKKEIKDSDILVSAVGKSNLITADMVNENQILIDAATIYKEDKVVGDISEEAKEKAKLTTPVPGGVGPITVAVLLRNLVESYKKQV